MAAKTTLNATNLETLGVERLAELLIDISAGDANTKRRLRLELIGRDNPGRLAGEIRKRMTAIGAAETMVGSRTLKGFRGDLKSLRELIIRLVEPSEPEEALELLWTFLGLSSCVVERTLDSTGETLALFKAVSVDIQRLTVKLSPPVVALLERTVGALLSNHYGQSDGLIPGLAMTFGESGLKTLKDQLLEAAKSPEKRSAARPKRLSRWKRRQMQATQRPRRTRQEIMHMTLEAIADAASDVDAFIALQVDPRQPGTALRIAKRLHAAGRSDEAVNTLDAARGRGHEQDLNWVNLRIGALEASGKTGEAQSLRLQTFRQKYDPLYLRAYLKRLPDFDDVEAEDAELDAMITAQDTTLALRLLVQWPSLDRAARLVNLRSKEVDGEDREQLSYAAERLAQRYPLEASLLYRRMVESILMPALSVHYAEAVAYIWETERLDAGISEYGEAELHDQWISRLRDIYRHRRDFWERVES